jgi:hypothetical protein
MGNRMSVLRGVGDGTFGAANHVPAGMYPYDVAAVDLDHDGDLDLVVPNHTSSDVTILINCGGGAFQ